MSNLSDIGDKTKSVLNEGLQQGEDAVAKGVDKSQDALDSMLNYLSKSVKSKPITAVAVSLCAGIFLSLCWRKGR